MRRETIALRIISGAENEFSRHSREAWPKLLAQLDRENVKNLSVWCVEDLVFCYCEVHSGIKAPLALFYEAVQDCCEEVAGLKEPMMLMYEDIGFIREDKTKITHRVFITKLKPGCREKYKHRHDVLAESRGGTINPGPESNFTIWNGGDYIFGYCELDKSMLKEPSDEERKITVEWETRMLEIMDWITDDVDWLTGLKHKKIKLLFA
jgi:L-rhamnose mutarotase